VLANEKHHEDQIHIEPMMFGNGWIAFVKVNDVVVQNDSDATGMCATREESFAQGERRAREYIESRR
jgi:hypothetical protein